MKAFHLEQRPTEMDHSKTLALTYLLPCVLERQLPESGAPSFPLTPEPLCLEHVCRAVVRPSTLTPGSMPAW